MRAYLLSSFLLTLLLAASVFLMLRDKPPNAGGAAVASDSSFPVITPDNVDRLTPIVTLTRGGTNYENEFRNPVWSPDGGLLAVIAGGSQGNPDPGIWLYAVDNTETPVRQIGHESAYHMVFSPDGRWLATLSDTGFVGGRALVWDVDTGERLFVLRGEVVRVRGMQFNRDGTRFITNDEANVWIWDVATGRQLSFLQAGCSLAFNQDVTIVAGSDCDWTGAITLHDLETGHRALVGEQNSLVSDIAISPDDSRLAAWDNDCGLKIWGLMTGSADMAIIEPECDLGRGRNLAFSPDGSVLASWSYSGGTVELWSVATGGQLTALEGHFVPGYEGNPGGNSLDVMFNPDGALIASFWDDNSVTEDRNLRLWDAATGELLRTIPDEFSATFSPDGTMLATDSSDGSVKIWAVGE